jgi:hypothetical protein
MAGYIICRYILPGDNLLSRRLDAVVALFILIFLFTAIEKFFTKNLFVSILIIFFGSIAITASYSLGPYSRVVSADEFKAAQFVWSQSSGDTKHCVVGETYQLLALEAASQKQIIGGGFPIDENFGQSQLTALYYSFNNGETGMLRNTAKQLTGASECFFIGSINDKIYSEQIAQFGNLVVYTF